LDPRKFAHVAGDQGQSPRQGLAGDQHVIGANRRAQPAQPRPDFGGTTRIVFIERKNLEAHAIKAVQCFVRALPVVDTVIELMHDQCRKLEERAWMVPYASKQGSLHCEERGDCVCIEKIGHLRPKKASSSGRSCSGTGSSTAAIKSSSNGPVS